MSKLIRKTTHPTKDLTLICYTKRAFYKNVWNEETRNARGHVYDGEGELVSCPFPKLHNLDEVEWASRDELIRRLEDHSHQVMVTKKYNGHLCILFNDGEEWINTTKGSFVHDFIELDRIVLHESGFTDDVLDEIPENWTLMFEIIADYDRHLLTDRHISSLGGEYAILVGINDRETGRSVPYETISSYFSPMGIWTPYNDDPPMAADELSDILGFSLTATKSDWSGFIDYLFSHKNTEGFVLHDLTDDFRVKIKTNWFIRNRYLFQFNSEKTKKLFLEHKDSPEAYDIIPEELHHKYTDVIKWYEEFLDSSYHSIMESMQILFSQLKTKTIVFDWINDNPDISTMERNILKMYASGSDEEELEPEFRKLFCDKFDGFSLAEDI